MNGQINDRIKLKEETVRHRRKDSHVDRFGMESPETRLCTHGHVMLTRMPGLFGRKRTVLSTNDAAKLDIHVQ